MPRVKNSTFTSYIDDDDTVSVAESEMQEILGSVAEANLEPALLPGEIEICRVNSALRFVPYTDRKNGESGLLVCTTFKLSFVTAHGHDEDAFTQHNKLIGENDISLVNIDCIYQVSKNKRKKLVPGGSISGSVKNLEIHCKDFRIHTFGFKFATKSEAKLMAGEILRHAFPARLDLLFAFEYKGDVEPRDGNITPRYRRVDDWEKDLQRLNVRGYRATQCNPAFRLSESMGECIVVPSSLSNGDLSLAVPQFINYRAPSWSYSHSNGAALVRMSHLTPDTSLTQWEARMLDAVRMAHPKQERPYMYDLSHVMPSLHEVASSYHRLRSLCMPVTLKDVQEGDSNWYSSLSSTGWLANVSKCLGAALRVSDQMSIKGLTVVLREHDSRDLTCIVSSLVQLMLDPHSRSIDGFQALVEREWVSPGHRFNSRCGITHNPEVERCPLFLLFLDCTWQLTRQFPSAFEFSETYLASLWDSVCLGLFDNFLFNSERERITAPKKFAQQFSNKTVQKLTDVVKPPPKLMSVWDWDKQFDDQTLALGKNPLYMSRTQLDLNIDRDSKGVTNGAGTSDNDFVRATGKSTFYARQLSVYYHQPPSRDAVILRPVVLAPSLKFWSYLYLRWITPLQILGGGSAMEYLHQCIVVEEIICLQHRLRSLETMTPLMPDDRSRTKLIFSFDTPRPASRSQMLTSSFPFSPGAASNFQTSLGTPLHLFLENSLVLDNGDLNEFESSMDD